MSDAPAWQRVGRADELAKKPLQAVVAGQVPIALSFRDGKFAAVSGVCNHAGGPLGGGRFDAEGFIVCPWHGWEFHPVTGAGKGGDDAVPRHDVKVENGDVFVDANPATKRVVSPHPAHPLEREPKRAGGPLRVAGISTTAMNRDYPRYSTSEALLKVALEHAGSKGAETKLIRLDDLKFKTCQGYYSKAAGACTWPCTITQMDPKDELTEVYEALVHWADVVLVSTSIRWGAPSSLYFKMIERLNCVQNQITIEDNVLIRHKTAAFLITGGQDNVQAVAGQMLMFFGEIGFTFPQFPFVAHTRGWAAEDMENNVKEVKRSESLREGTRSLVDRCLETAKELVAAGDAAPNVTRGGRKACGPG